MSKFSQDLSGFKAVVFDIDGVLSGRTVAMNDRGELIRTTNVHDGYAMRLASRAGIILGIGRAIGETMAVVMIAGNQTVLPKSLLSGVRTMTANIVMEMGYATDLHRGALIGTGVVLFIFILLINVCFSLVKKKETK